MVLTVVLLWDNPSLAFTANQHIPMIGILAIDTATEACSVALCLDGQVEERHELAARQHSQRIFSMLRELLPDGNLRERGVDAIAWGCGPGSFTGLRIAASAVQGLAFTNELPVLCVSTLACQAQTAFSEGIVEEGGLVLSTLDARIKEIYAAVYRIEAGLPVVVQEPVACAPEQLVLSQSLGKVLAVGSGCQFKDAYPADVRNAIEGVSPELLPRARDLAPLASAMLNAGQACAARDVQPVYVRDEINWKKIPEQGKRK